LYDIETNQLELRNLLDLISVRLWSQQRPQLNNYVAN